MELDERFALDATVDGGLRIYPFGPNAIHHCLDVGPIRWLIRDHWPRRLTPDPRGLGRIGGRCGRAGQRPAHHRERSDAQLIWRVVTSWFRFGGAPREGCNSGGNGEPRPPASGKPVVRDRTDPPAPT